MSDSNEKLTNHNYDGIQEYDNSLPNWWLFTFFGTIIFSFIYWIHYEFGGGTSLMTELKSDLAQIQSIAKNSSGATSGKSDSEEDLQKLMANADQIKLGREIFDSKCSVCHGKQLEGLIGPNLVDPYWIHGKGQLMDIAQIVRTGVADKGMPPWENVLKNDEIQAVVAFVGSQKGTHPANPKPPQGEKIDQE